MCETLNGAVTTPRFTTAPEGGYYAVRQSGWHYNTKYWKVDMVPEADMAITNISFQSQMNKTNGPTHFYIRKYVNGVQQPVVGSVLLHGQHEHPDRREQLVLVEPELPAGTAGDHGAGGPDHPDPHPRHGRHQQLHRHLLVDLQPDLPAGGVGTNGITEVTDEEFTSGSFKLLGSTWDDDSGIRATNTTDAAKRPRYSMNAPDGGVFATNVPFAFTNAGRRRRRDDGGATASSPPTCPRRATPT
jgi:hypothetical protein